MTQNHLYSNVALVNYLQRAQWGDKGWFEMPTVLSKVLTTSNCPKIYTVYDSPKFLNAK